MEVSAEGESEAGWGGYFQVDSWDSFGDYMARWNSELELYAQFTEKLAGCESIDRARRIELVYLLGRTFRQNHG